MESTGKTRAIGVCSWSLQPRTARDLALRIAECGLAQAQIALGPIRVGAMTPTELRAEFAAVGATLRSGMMSTVGEDYSSLDSIARTGGVRPDVHWPENFAIARDVARIARAMELPLVTFHAGFIPHDAHDPERAQLIARLRAIVDVFADEGVRVGFETGQETSATLLEFLGELDRPSAGVNFDPANMILYGMGDPVLALRELGPRVVQVHVKDARPTRVPGTWGEEVPVGTGSVDWPAFFAVLDVVQPQVDLMIEREAGDQRIADVRTAVQILGRLLGRPASPSA